MNIPDITSLANPTSAQTPTSIFGINKPAPAPTPITSLGANSLGIIPNTNPNSASSVRTLGGPTSGIVSSAQPTISQQAGQGVIAAANAVTGSNQQTPPQQPTNNQQNNNGGNTTASGTSNNNSSGTTTGGYVDPVTQILSQVMAQNQGAMTQVGKQQLATLQANYQIGQQMIQSSYNSGLAQMNAQYGSAFQNLQLQHQNDVGNAIATAAQLNPYSGPDSNTQAYVRKINQLYQVQSSQLTAQASAAQAALTNGQVQAYGQLNEDMNNSQIQFSQNMANFQISQNQALVANAQYQQGRQSAAFTQFRDILNQTSLDPSTVKGLDDNQLVNTAWGQLGLKAGLTPDEIRQQAETPTIAGQNLQLNAIKTQVAQQNAGTNAFRAQLQNVTTSTTVNKALSDKAAQYSGFLNAVDGIKNLQTMVSGNNSSDILNAVNTFIKNPESNAANISAALGQNGQAIISAIAGHPGTPPSASEIATFFGNSAQTADTLKQRLTTAASDLQNKITTQASIDQSSPIPGMPANFLTNVSSALSSINQPSTQQDNSSSGFSSFLNSSLGGKYNISL